MVVSLFVEWRYFLEYFNAEVEISPFYGTIYSSMTSLFLSYKIKGVDENYFKNNSIGKFTLMRNWDLRNLVICEIYLSLGKSVTSLYITFPIANVEVIIVPTYGVLAGTK